MPRPLRPVHVRQLTERKADSFVQCSVTDVTVCCAQMTLHIYKVLTSFSHAAIKDTRSLQHFRTLHALFTFLEKFFPR